MGSLMVSATLRMRELNPGDVMLSVPSHKLKMATALPFVYHCTEDKVAILSDLDSFIIQLNHTLQGCQSIAG